MVSKFHDIHFCRNLFYVQKLYSYIHKCTDHDHNYRKTYCARHSHVTSVGFLSLLLSFFLSFCSWYHHQMILPILVKFNCVQNTLRCENTRWKRRIAIYSFLYVFYFIPFKQFTGKDWKIECAIALAISKWTRFHQRDTIW